MDEKQKQFLEDAYGKYYSKLYNYVYYRLLNAPLADDIVSDTFVKLIKNHHLYNPAHSLSAWIFTIARNLITDYFRQNARSPIVAAGDDYLAGIPDPGTSPDEGMVLREKCRAVRGLLQTLSERERSIIALRFWGEMSYAEIGKHLGLTEKNVGVILSRSMGKLRKKCRDFGLSPYSNI